MTGDPLRTAPRQRVGLAVAILLLGVTGLVVALSSLQDVADRASSPETIVRQYFQALESGDEESALTQIQPSARPEARPFVRNNLRNRYTISGIAVQQPSLLTRFTGPGNSGQSMTVFLDITQAVGGEQWQAAPQVPLIQADGRWYLGQAPLDIGS